jgi:hypothetical protein
MVWPMENNMAKVRKRSFQDNLRNMMYLLMRTVMTERDMVTIAIQATRLTMGPLLLDDISGVRAMRPSIVAMVGRPCCRSFVLHWRVSRAGAESMRKDQGI